jgi:hypothetical protein
VHGIAARGGPGITTTTRLTGSPLVPVLKTGGGRRQKTGDTGDPRNAHHTNASIRVSLVGLVALLESREPDTRPKLLGPWVPLGLILARIHSTSLVAPGLWVILVWFLVPFFWCLHLSLPCLALPCLTYLSWCPRERGFHPSFLSFSISTSSFYSQINFSHLGLVLSPCPLLLDLAGILAPDWFISQVVPKRLNPFAVLQTTSSCLLF